MKIDESCSRLIKERIEKYYQNCKNIEWQSQRLERLAEKLKEIERDLNNPRFNFHLCADVRAMSYDGAAVSGGMHSSAVEREIEGIYARLEKEKASAEMEILETNMLIRRLESENEEIGHCISFLKNEHKDILEKKFRQNKNLIQISFETNMSKSNVGRVLGEIYSEFYKHTSGF